MTLIFKFFKIISIQILIVLSLFIIFLSFHGPRHYFLSGISKIPEFYFTNYLKTDLINRNFDSVSRKLDTYLGFLNLINIKKNRLVPGYISVLNNAYDLTILDSEKLLFKNIMNKSLDLDDDNIFLLANIIEINNIFNPKSNHQLDLYNRSLKINPSFKKIYVEAIKDALRNNDYKKINYFCDKYNNSILGEAKDYNKNYILGKALNRIAIYVSSNDSYKEQIFLNEGVSIGSNEIIFNTLNLKNLVEFSVLTPNNSNLVYHFDKIEIINNNNKVNLYNKENLKVISSNGILKDNIKILNLSNFSNRIDFFLPKAINGSINKIILHLHVSKSNFANIDQCQNKDE